MTYCTSQALPCLIKLYLFRSVSSYPTPMIQKMWYLLLMRFNFNYKFILWSYLAFHPTMTCSILLRSLYSTAPFCHLTLPLSPSTYLSSLQPTGRSLLTDLIKVKCIVSLWRAVLSDSQTCSSPVRHTKHHTTLLYITTLHHTVMTWRNAR